MTMLVTTLLFGLLTAVFVAWHLRRGAGGPAPAPARRCPRCHSVLAPGSADCPSCGVPIQAFELVTARTVEGEAAGDSGPRHAIVRADMCVGCGTCVAACPHPGAIRMVSKLATIDVGVCQGEATCAAACPVGAIVVSTGAAVQRVEVPDLNPHFESNVPGLYIVGELGGRGLIKNAINEGKIAVQGIAERRRSGAPAMEHGELVFDVIIVGSGPAGLSAGLEAHRRGLRYLVLEQGDLSDSIRKYPRKKLLFAEPLTIPLYGDLWVADGSKEALLDCWNTVIEKTRLDVRTRSRVERVDAAGDRFEVGLADRIYRARAVVLAMGRRGTPRRLGVAGEALDKVLYDIIEMEAFAGQRMLVVGGGDSAIESALGLANQKGTTVTLSYRGTTFSRIKERNREKIEAAVRQRKVTLLLESQVKEVRPDVVVLEHQGRVHLLPNDGVIIRIGGEAPYPFLQRMGVRIVRKEIALPPETSAAAGEAAR